MAYWQLKGSLVFDALTTEQGMSMLYNLFSTLRSKICKIDITRICTAIAAYSPYVHVTCTGILQRALARPLDHTCS